jgi:hypothetical protein
LFPPVTIPTAYYSVSAQMIRNETGHWELLFGNIPTNTQAILVDWCDYSYWYDIGPFDFLSYDYWIAQEVPVPVSSLTNGIYVIPDWQSTNYYCQATNAGGLWGWVCGVRPMQNNGEIGVPTQAGYLPEDAPCWIDGRQYLEQNLLYQLRAATITQPNATLYDSIPFFGGYPYYDFPIPVNTNYVESGFYHLSQIDKSYGDGAGLYTPLFLKMDDLWPITANYQLNQNLFDTNYSGPAAFTWAVNLVPNPVPAVLGISDPYWISQGLGDLADLGAYANSGNLYLESGKNNLFGLSFEAALINDGNAPPYSPLSVAPGRSISMTNVDCFYSQTADPVLRLSNYYFAPVSSPGTSVPGPFAPNQVYPIPCLAGFSTTNQSGPLITSVGTPTLVGGWAKFSLQNGSSSKYAYLGQYFMTNAFVMTNGVLTANTTGIVSPYGDFFPTQPGMVAMLTMPDINTGAQGTGVVRVISMNVDANHDGTLDFTYQGPDFVSASAPYRFWVNDTTDEGDFGGTGVPGQGPQGNGVSPIEVPIAVPYQGFPLYLDTWAVHGRRDLVNFFPVYLNIASLFQSNALSAGVSTADKNWQFVLSQADSALRFAYTDLTPTNYMNFLRDTNESGTLASAQLVTITNTGVLLTNTFLNSIASANKGIILVEAATATTQPLVLTIYHGTNQIAQTSLPLSITGVEQMFRSKNLLLQADSRAILDRLTDASVPNEPNTINKNFVFLHGYNVNPNEARGAFADMYKRLYWSGSHAKFYGVMWNGYDTQSQILPNVTGNLETNVLHAFNTASALNTFLNSLSGTNIVAAHSLGNMVVLSTLNDYTNQSISLYFMLDAAVPMEALDGTTPQSTNLVHTDWTSYGTNLWASYWHNLFTGGDGRSQLTWNNHLAAGLQNAAVYNFYSSGEEVLRAYPNSSTPSFVGFGANQILQSVFGTLPIASYLWNMQELQKGRSPLNDVLGSNHGGWKFNDLVYGTNGILATSWTHMSPAAAASLTPAQLQTNAFFDVTDFVATFPPDYTQDLNLFTTAGSGYARLFRNRLLSDTIPALSLPVGANPVTILNQPGNPHNFDMQSAYENGWPLGRPARKVGALAQGEWWHSDFQQVAYTFTYKLFNQFVTVGNLK